MTEASHMSMQDAEGFPQVDRDLMQIEEMSQKLRTKASPLDQSEDAFAASRLLAQQGVNTRRCFLSCTLISTQLNSLSSTESSSMGSVRRLLRVIDIQHLCTSRYNRDLLELELRPTHEDVFQSQPSTVDEYLQQVHESTVVTAIQVSLSVSPWPQRSLGSYMCTPGGCGRLHDMAMHVRSWQRVLHKEAACQVCSLWTFDVLFCICAQDDNVPVCSLRSLQEAQRQTDETFQQFMTDSLQANWQQAKRRLLDSMLPSGGQGGFAHSTVPAALGQSDGRPEAKPVMLPASLRDRKLSVRPPTNASRCSLHAEKQCSQRNAACIRPAHSLWTFWAYRLFLCCRRPVSRAEGAAVWALQELRRDGGATQRLVCQRAAV